MSTISSGTTLTTALVQTGDTTGDLVIKTGSSNTTAMTISGSTQNVGIGTSSPLTRLTVNASGATTTQATNKGDIQIINNPTSSTAGGGLEFAAASFGSGYGWRLSTIDPGGGVGFIFTTRQNSSSWSEQMRIDSSGNVGIGTSSPGTKLDAYSSGTTSTLIRTRNDTTSVYLDANNGYSYLNTFTNHPMLFGTNNTERMRIDSSGNVGIGTSSPARTLDVRGYVSSSDGTTRTEMVNGGGVGYIGTQSNHPLAFQTNNTERMRLTANGGLAFNGASNFGSSGQLLQSNGDSAPTWVTPTVNGTARAWVNFNGSGGGIRASFNVTSISVNGTGRYTVNMTSALADANYARVITASGLSGDGNGVCSNTDVVSGNSVTATTTAFGILLTISGQSGYRDSPFVSAAVFR